MTHLEYLAHTYIADRHREAHERLVGRHHDGSRQVTRRVRTSLPRLALA
jgi:hypothetical protein